MAQKKKGNLKLPFPFQVLFTKIQFLDDGPVALNVTIFQIVQDPAALADQTDEGALRAEILAVTLQMLSQVRDTVGK